MIRRVRTLLFAMLASLALACGLAPLALAIPTYSLQCTNCHPANPAVIVTVRQLAVDSAIATYSVEVSTTPGFSGWAVFGDSGKVAYGFKASGQFSVSVGSTYTVYGVGHQTNNSGSTVIHPLAPAQGSTSTPTATPLSVLMISRPALSRRIPIHGRFFRVFGTLGRAHPVTARVTIVIQRLIGRRYKAYGTRIGSISAGASRYNCRMRLGRRGHYRIRVLHHDAYDLPSKSAWRAFRVA